MTITLTPDLEKALTEQARQQGTTPEAFALAVLRDKLRTSSAVTPDVPPQDEWERRLLSLAVNCGVSLSNEALSSEGLYD